MFEIVSPLLWIVAGICFYAGFSHELLAVHRRAGLHLVFGLMCFLAGVYALCSQGLYRSATTVEYISTLRQQLMLSNLWNVAFVWFVALYAAHRPRRFLLVHNTLCMVVLFLNWGLPDTLLFAEVNAVATRTLPWGEQIQNVDAIARPLAALEYLPSLLSFGFAFVCCHLQFQRAMYSSALFLAAATSIQLLALPVDVLVDLGGSPFIYASEFAFVSFILLMTLQLAKDMEVAERILRESEQRFRQMAETIREVFYLAEPATGKILYTSPAYETLTGRARTQLETHPLCWLDAVLPGDRNSVNASYKNLLGGIPFDEEYRIERPDGSLRWVSDHAFPINDERGRVYRVAGVARDITERKEAEALLREAEMLQRLTLENISDAVFVTDDAGAFEFICPNAHVIFGYDVEEVQTFGCISRLLGDELCDARQLEQAGEIRNLERRIQDKFSRRHDLLVNVRRVSINSGTRLFTCRDITERKRAEEELRASEQRLQKQFAELEQIYRTSPVGLCFMDRTLRFVRINDELAEINGLSVEEHLGRHLRDVLPDIAESIEPIYRRVLETGVPELNFQVDMPSRTEPHEMLNYLVSYYPVSDNNSTVIGVSTVVQEITERKRIEQALRESESQTKAILASLSAHIAVIDRSGVIVAVNPAWVKFARDNEGPFALCNVGANYLDVCRTAAGDSADKAPAVVAGLQAILSDATSEFTLEYPCHSPTQHRWFLLHATPLRNGKGGAVVSHTNITDRIEAEQLVRVGEERLRAILNTAADAVINIDRRGMINSVNRATEQMFGYAPDELLGRNVNMLMPSPYRQEHDGYISRYLETREARIIGIGRGREVVGRRRDGSTFPADLAVSEVKHMGLFTGIIRDITDRKEAEEALRHAHEFSESLINTARNIVLVLDTAGRIVRFNPYMEELTGWQLDDAEGRVWFDMFLPERDRSRIRDLFERATSGERIHGHIISIVTNKGHEREIEWYDAPLTDADGQLIGLLFTGQDVTERQMLQREILEIAAEEQRRIGQDLHDGTQQQLTGLGLLAQNLAAALQKLSHAKEGPRPGQTARILDRVEELHHKAMQVQSGLEQAAREVHQLARGLIPVEVDARGLMSSLSELARRINEFQHMACTFACHRPVEVADNFTATHLYRIAQEAVNNAVKHSRADRIEIILSQLDEIITLRVLDNGKGIDDKRPGTGLGLRIMAYRAELIGAAFTVRQATGGGTEVVCTVPRS